MVLHQVGGALGPIHWFQLKFLDRWSKVLKELLWQWLCGGISVIGVIIWQSDSGRDRVMHLIRCLSFFLAWWDVTLVCVHNPGVDNGVADALSTDFSS